MDIPKKNEVGKWNSQNFGSQYQGHGNSSTYPCGRGTYESVNLTLSQEVDLDEVRELLNNTPGVVVVDDLANNSYPMPLDAEGKDEVFVGRIRKDESQQNGLNLWIVADNLRKGAATNTVQIAEYLIQ